MHALGSVARLRQDPVRDANMASITATAECKGFQESCPPTKEQLVNFENFLSKTNFIGSACQMKCQDKLCLTGLTINEFNFIFIVINFQIARKMNVFHIETKRTL